MIAVIFEARAMPDQQGRYLALAAELKAQLSQIAGFIEIERFQSLSTEGKVLSLSWWESEEARRPSHDFFSLSYPGGATPTGILF